MVERMLREALRKGDYDTALRLHCRDVEMLEKELREPHRLFVSVRNSIQFCLWKVHGCSDK